MPLTWSDLTLDEQIAVQDMELHSIVAACVEMGPNFLPEELWPNFDRAVADMERMQTPWFLAERLMEDAAIKDHLVQYTDEWCREVIYLVGNEVAVRLPFIKKK